jgi:hypothetical protein
MPRIADRIALPFKPTTRDRKKRQTTFQHEAADITVSPCCGAKIHIITANVAVPALEGQRRCLECWKVIHDDSDTQFLPEELQ